MLTHLSFVFQTCQEDRHLRDVDQHRRAHSGRDLRAGHQGRKLQRHESADAAHQVHHGRQVHHRG